MRQLLQVVESTEAADPAYNECIAPVSATATVAVETPACSLETRTATSLAQEFDSPHEAHVIVS